MFEAVTHLFEGLNLEALLTLEVEKFVIFLGDIRRPTVFIIGQQSIFS
jgi:hypothetical protein